MIPGGMKRLKPGQVLAPNQSLVDYIDFNQAGLRPGALKLTMFPDGASGPQHAGIGPRWARRNAVIHVKLFDPCGAATWYFPEWDRQDEAYGYVMGLGDRGEYGSVPLRELAYIEGPLGIGIEIDICFLPLPVGRQSLRKPVWRLHHKRFLGFWVSFAYFCLPIQGRSQSAFGQEASLQSKVRV